MEIKVDYLEQYETQQAMLHDPALEHEKMAPEQDEKIRERLGRIYKRHALDTSQLRLVKNQDKWDYLINEVFTLVCQIAEMQFGRAVLVVDEESLTGRITYWGRDFMYSDIWSQGIPCLAKMIEMTAEMVITQEDGLIRFDFIFQLHD